MVKFRNIALIIGINNYESDPRIAQLMTARFDAIKLAEILNRDYGYNTELLTDENQQATCKNIREALSRLSDRVQAAQNGEKVRLIFYFAGHGIPSQGENGEAGYLVAQDAEVEQLKNFLPMKELQVTLTNLGCHHVLIILDCCFAGAFKFNTRHLGFKSKPEEISKQRYKQYIDSAAWQVIASAAHDQTALDITLDNRARRGDIKKLGDLENPHSPFAATLFQALDKTVTLDRDNSHTPADYTKDGITTATELFVFLDDEMRQKIEGSNHQQIPRFWPLWKHDKGEFFFETGEFDPDRLPDTPELSQENNPYRGLESFDEAQQRFFYGRDALVQELKALVNKDDHPFTIVLGVSGSGKSSLVKAGLIPKLRQFQDSTWQILTPMRPGLSAFKALAKIMLALKQESNPDEYRQLEKLTEKLKEARKKSPGNEDLTKLLTAWRKSDPDGKLWLIVKEFEHWKQLVEDDPDRNLLEDLRQATLSRSSLVLENREEMKTYCNDEEQKKLEQFYQHCITEIELWSVDWQNNPSHLCLLITQCVKKDSTRKLLLVIDQFEELLTLSQDDERESFLVALRAILQASPQQLRVVATLRSDFESRFSSSEHLNDFWQLENRFFVRPMQRYEFRQVIEGPAQDYVLTFGVNENNYSLVDQLIDEVELMPGGLSLLSFTLSELYREYVRSDRGDRTLSWEDYKKLNGVTGSLTRRATQEYDALDDSQKATMRRVMLRMVAIDGGGVTRRRVPEPELVYPSDEENKRVGFVIEQLVKARLIVKGQETGEQPYIEPAHDFLIKGWDLLQEWVKEEQENLGLMRRLTLATNDWKGNDQGLWIEEFDRLAKLKKVLESDVNNWLNELEKKFVTRSIKEREDRIKKLEEDLHISEERRLAAELELASITTLRQFENEKGIVAAIQAIEVCQKLLEWEKGKDIRLEQYPAVSPLFTLQTILDNIYEQDYFFYGSEQDKFWNWMNDSSLSKIETPAFDTGHGESNLTYSLDGQHIVTFEKYEGAITNSRWRVWEKSKEPITEVLHSDIRISMAQFSPDGTVIAIIGQIVKFYDLEGEILGQFKPSPNYYIQQIVFNFDASRIIVVEKLDGGEGTQHIHYLAKLMIREGYRRSSQSSYIFSIEEVSHHRYYGSARFAPDGYSLITGDRNLTDVHPVRVWNLIPRLNLKVANLEQQFPDSQTSLEIVWEDGLAKCIEQDTVIATLEGSENWFNIMILSPKRKYIASIASTTDAGIIRIWTVSGQYLTQFGGLRGVSSRIVFSPQDNYCAVIENKNLGVSIISVNQNFQPISKIKGNNSQFSSLNFSPDEQRIATVGLERTIRLWDVKARQLAQLNLNNPEIPLIMGHRLDMGDGFSPYVNFTKDGQWVVTNVSASRGSSPKLLWKVESPEDLIMRGRQWTAENWQDEIGLKIERLLGSALS